MPYFLEYTTGASAGSFTVHGVDPNDALVKAKAALQGLECTNAVLRFSPDHKQVLGKGAILAAYRRTEGWSVEETWPPQQ